MAAPFEEIFDLLPRPAWILDRATLRFLAANDAAVSHFGYPRETLLSMTFVDLHVPSDAMNIRGKLGMNAPSQGSYSWRQQTRAGDTVLAPVVWRPVAFHRVPAILMMSESTPGQVRRLVQESEENRARLEALSWRLVTLQETERMAIARELHDELGQLLTGLKLLLQPEPGEPKPLDEGKRVEIMGIASELMGRIRDLSMDLRPPMLEDLGLAPTLQWFFERFTARTQVRVTFRDEVGSRRLPEEIEIAAFRIVQEALTNVARHSEAVVADVQIRVDEEGVWILIEDRGRGFHAGRHGRSAGLTGMQERARLVGGHFTLESAPGAGTRIAVVLPLPLPPGGGTPRRIGR